MYNITIGISASGESFMTSSGPFTIIDYIYIYIDR